MPDWFYRTVSQPLLFALPADTSRRFVMGFMGTLGNLPGGIGQAVIDFMGHMKPPPELRGRKGTLELDGPVGASCWFDGEGRALAAWSRFGFGAIELGPTWKHASNADIRFSRDDVAQVVETRFTGACLAPEALCSRASQVSSGPELMVRLCPPSGVSPEQLAAQATETLAQTKSDFTAWTLDLTESSQSWSREDWEAFWRELGAEIGDRSILESLHLVLTPALIGGDEAQAAMLDIAVAFGVRNWYVEYREALADGRQRIGGTGGVEWLKSQTRALRERFGPEPLIIAGGCITGTKVALELRVAGANLVMLDTGMIYSGPGLAKRINEALASRIPEAEPMTAKSGSVFQQSWFWGTMLGLGMLLGSLLALVIASTRVILPYDEVLCGITREQLTAFNPKLLLFLSHDRVSLAGTMVAIGVLYGGASMWGIRRGLHWTRVALLWSAGAGFFSFFLFLGFGYFDPFHGFVTAILFQLYVQCMVGEERPRRLANLPEWAEDRAWRIGQWGQFLLVLHGAGLLFAGLTITFVGLVSVFVPSDLEFIGTSPELLRELSSRLLPMIAHDRVTMGGMLVAAGIPFLLAALWGLGRGTRWLWWTLLLAGSPAYLCAIGVHFVIGYVDFFHLLPAFVGVALFSAGLFACRDWTWDRGGVADASESDTVVTA